MASGITLFKDFETMWCPRVKQLWESFCGVDVSLALFLKQLQRKASYIPNLHKFDSKFYIQAFQTDISL